MSSNRAPEFPAQYEVTVYIDEKGVLTSYWGGVQAKGLYYDATSIDEIERYAFTILAAIKQTRREQKPT